MFESQDEGLAVPNKNRSQGGGVNKLFSDGLNNQTTNPAGEQSRGRQELSKFSLVEKGIPELSRDKQATSRSKAGNSVSEEADIKEKSRKGENSHKNDGTSPTRSRAPTSPMKSRINHRKDTAQSSELQAIDLKEAGIMSPGKPRLPDVHQSKKDGSRREISRDPLQRLERSLNAGKSRETSKRTVEFPVGPSSRHVMFARGPSKYEDYSSKIGEFNVQEHQSKQSQDFGSTMAQSPKHPITKSNLKENSLPRIKMSNSLDRSASLVPR